MATGWNDLKQWALPTYWDASELRKWQLADGTNYEGLVADIGRALAIQNAELLADPLIAGLVSVTDEIAVEYATGTSNGFQVHTEYGRPDQKRGATTGHMLPLIAYDRALGWTWDMLRRARRRQIDADIADAMKDLKDRWQKSVLTRLFKSDYDSVGTGRSMPLADGGTADSGYVPIAYPERGGTFLYTHDHISNLNGITQANLETAVLNLWEHGYDAPFELLVAHADISSWTDTSAITGFVPKADGLIRYGMTADLANVANDYLGVIETPYGSCRVRASGRIPTTYWSLYKSYGALDQRNPLVVRQSPDYGTSAILMKGDHIREYPLEEAILFLEVGVGVMDRVGATAYLNGAGAYSTPTIS
jgi:hypothetical protein